jgi:hypothetical protein
MAIVLVFATLLLLSISTQAAAQPGDPPLEVYVHSPSVEGSTSLVVVYHANGTFDMKTLGRGGDGRHTYFRNGWWRNDGKQFCFQVIGIDDKPVCKPSGHLIGRAMVNE